VDRARGERLSGRWYVQSNKLCRHFKSRQPECAEMFVRDGAVRTAVGGYNVASGDVFKLDRSSRRTATGGTSGNRPTLKQVLTGIASVYAETCANGACSGGTSSPVPSAATDNSQCKASKSQCYASCASLSNEGPDILLGEIGSPRRQCKAQCQKIDC
jgi:hypothetical protein